MMRRRGLLGGTLGLVLLIALAGVIILRTRPPAGPQPPDRQATLAAIRLVNDAWLARYPHPAHYDWDWATYFSGDMAAYAATGDARYLAYARAWAQAHHYGLVDGSTTRIADHQAAGQVYLDLYALDTQPADLTAITASIHGMVTSSAPLHDWTWIDALNMAMPDFARLGVLTGDTRYFTTMAALYAYTFTGLKEIGLYDQTAHLWYRDSSFLPPHLSRHGRPIFWARGNAWVFAALAKVLAVLPASAPDRQTYLVTFRQMAAALLPLQRADGFWNVNLDDPLDHPGPETSGTSLFAFGLAGGMRTGILDRTSYMPALRRAWDGLLHTALQQDGTLGYVQGTGVGPDSSQPVTRHTTSDFGVGAFLLAANQVVQLSNPF
jgi:rhamnogalacturonyl hydrolase YesR